ncbi:MAG: hypothetical protein B6U95_07745 [Thermofilum sp. ex4484_82]|nr:MAG: hypothetical protein B6U95_07745 [Thermofilum sp. ex4484_82]OYT36908.1 MAG: hypothetical protein B6U96_07745 [Archaeoglobales archaeon ex4484_92]
MCGISGIVGRDLDSVFLVLKILEKYVGSKGYFQYSISRNVDEKDAIKGFGTGFMWTNERRKIRRVKRNMLIEGFDSYIVERCYNFRFFVGHTRWPSKWAPIGDARFTHPFSDCTNNIFVVHNGGFANYVKEYKRLKSSGHRFESEYDDSIVDSEIIPHLIEEKLKDREIDKDNVVNSVRFTLRKLVELSADGKPGNFAVLINNFPYVVLAQEKMTSGSRFKIWRKNENILFSTYKTISEAKEGLQYQPDLNIDKFVEMNKRIDEKMEELGYKPFKIMNPGEVILISEDKKIETYYVR